MFMKLSHVSAMVAVVALSSCGGQTLGAGSSAVSVAKALPPPDAPIMLSDFTSYRLGPLDVVSIEVFGAPTLTREGEVDAAGNLAVPLVGTVAAGGKTPKEVATLIANGLRGRYVNDPQVTVNIKKAVSQTVTIDGSVREPGIYPVVRRMTLQQAIASAKGADDLANLDNVAIFRTVGGEKMAALFSLKAIRAGRMPDPQIYANDIVVVGENATRRLLKDINNIPILGSFGRFIP
ncbi:polysaccharide biosynthesis/export family protein [Sphingomonas sp. RB1R13]|jgi:polysaccharide export outer membrane protein|uniref:polysaccharide biosynthesis/export family protein n=1 Tax=Sphingomonas sp. RB1R13 TaxID=3096159 RepID=UPI002FC6979C